MRVFSGLVCMLAAAVAMPAQANDTAAQLVTGGLEFVINDDIKMLSEELFISREEIRVVYEFQNNTDTDQKVLVAFPMPDIEPDWWGNKVIYEGCDGTGSCVLQTLPEGEYFGPRIGQFQ